MRSLAFLLFISSALAQVQVFKVENPKNVKFDEKEAVQAYWYAVEEFRSEYHIKDALSPAFTLVLGGDKEQLEYRNREVQLKRWDAVMFEQGVILMCFVELEKPDNIRRLLKSIEAQRNAKVDWKALRK